MGELDVGAADHLDGVDDEVGVILEPCLKLRGDGEHGGRAVGVAGVDPHGVHVLDEADGDLLAPGVPHHLQFQLLPPQHRLLHEDLPDRAGREAAGGNGPELLQVVGEAAAGPPHGVGGPDHHRQPDPSRRLQGLLQGGGDLAAGGLDSEPCHGLLEGFPVLAPLDGIQVDADDPHPVLIQHPGVGQGRGEVEAGLAPQVGEKGVGAFLADDLGQGLHVEGFDIGGIGHGGIGHDGGRV